MSDIIKYQEEINKQVANKEVFTSLCSITFKGLNTNLVKRAMLEGMLRGFEFDDFLNKNVYAIPFGKDAYSLVTSIDYSRKVGMRSGVCGKSEPRFEEKEGQIISCSITIKRNVNGIVGDYSEKVYFNEYTTGRNLWASKPRTMIAKVAEMHALRMACPEELSQLYVEEEMEQGNIVDIIDNEDMAKIKEIQTVEELKTYYKDNEGKGKAFAKAITERKAELESK